MGSPTETSTQFFSKLTCILGSTRIFPHGNSIFDPNIVFPPRPDYDVAIYAFVISATINLSQTKQSLSTSSIYVPWSLLLNVRVNFNVDEASRGSLRPYGYGVSSSPSFSDLASPHSASPAIAVQCRLRYSELIRSIPLIRAVNEDSLIWHFTIDGVYSVRSGYRTVLQFEAETRDGGIGSSGGGNSAIWKTLWSLNLPEKLKIFWWRALENIIPSKDNLVRKKIEIPSACKRCGAEIETSAHCFWVCPFAKKVWGMFDLHDRIPDGPFDCNKDAHILANWIVHSDVPRVSHRHSRTSTVILELTKILEYSGNRP
ncbi:hypothetical protein RIF29_20852 [Crotalaria pallida]|uniref:Reverse transcriptase zinc-binding domain-containing protein n=1 Tax=Crotalaria pallida TaxID=3830 RepID=A0AAN9I914_CROPI